MEENSSAADPVTTIVLFRVPPETSAAFIEAWTASNDFMSAQPGLIDGALYRATSDAAEHLFVNVATWATQAALDAARAGHAQTLAEQGVDQKAVWASLGVSVTPSSYRAHTAYRGPSPIDPDVASSVSGQGGRRS
jgi:heme-degrading monooxygenase HmoA